MTNLDFARPWIRIFFGTTLLLAVSISASSQVQGSQRGDRARKSDKVALEDANVTPPRVLYRPDPEYPQEARRARNQGTCILSLSIGTDGLPRDIKIVRGLGMGLDESALATAGTWRYEPARKDGKPVEVQSEVKVRFRLHGGGADKIANLWDRSDENDPKADLELSNAYFKGRGMPKDEQRGLEFLKMAADWNLPEAQFLMGEHFYKNRSGSPDYVTAYMWYALSKRGGFEQGDEMLKTLAPRMSPEQLSEAETRIDHWPEAPPK
jgi:TonB family protein